MLRGDIPAESVRYVVLVVLVIVLFFVIILFVVIGGVQRVGDVVLFFFVIVGGVGSDLSTRGLGLCGFFLTGFGFDI